jgi:hypothetical protein
MPACFQLLRRDSKTPTVFQVIDAELCQNLGLEFDDKHWTYAWYDIIGFKLATGNSYEQITDQFYELMEKRPKDADFYRQLIRINHYLLEHYESDS